MAAANQENGGITVVFVEKHGTRAGDLWASVHLEAPGLTAKWG